MMCIDGKVHYSTLRGAAEAALDQLDKFGRCQRPYQCERCGAYHLSSQPMNGAASVTPEMVRYLAATLSNGRTR